MAEYIAVGAILVLACLVGIWHLYRLLAGRGVGCPGCQGACGNQDAASCCPRAAENDEEPTANAECRTRNTG